LKYENDWNAFALDVLGVHLDNDQKCILESIQNNKRITVRSSNARGKDYVAAVASLCFIYTKYPAKVINTAPTGRQVVSVMMSEIGKLHANAPNALGGDVLSTRISFEGHKDHFLEGFKSADKDTEAWQGYHSQNLMLVITEASGISDETFHSIEGILTGDSKLVLIGNPIRNTGEYAKSFKSSNFIKFSLSALNAPNVLAKKTVIPGQVDWDWVDDKVKRWAVQIDEKDVDSTQYDFKWENENGSFWYRPDDLFKVKVLGEFPSEDESQLIPMAWVEASFDRWREWQAAGSKNGEPLRLGVDVAGMGRDKTVYVHKHGKVVSKIESASHADHMETTGRIKNILQYGDKAFIDTIGEGAGVYSRLKEQDVSAISVKFSEGAEGYTDFTGQRTFANMRAYLHWAIRDSLDPKFKQGLALPPDDELLEELTAISIKKLRSDGSIILEEKDEIKKRLGRSPDKSDALANTFYPEKTNIKMETILKAEPAKKMSRPVSSGVMGMDF
jgi:hypothetical protein